MNATARHRITKARIAVSNREAFLSSLVFRLIPCETEDVPATATDGVHVFYNPAFVERVTDEELRAAMEHETYHCAFGYWMRQGDRDPDLWNKAHDYAINPLCQFKLPQGSLIDSRFLGMAAERIYEILKREQAPKSGGCGCLLQPAGANGQKRSPAEVQQIAEGWELATIQAANTARAAGKLSADIARIVDDLKKPSVNWRDILQRFMRERIKSDYSLIPPNRRYAYRGLYLHSIADEERIGRVVDVFDTSGSIYAYPDLLAQFMGEQKAIVQDTRPQALTFIECDSAIRRVAEYDVETLPDTLELLGGGGTDFRPPFDYIAAEGFDPECLIYFTDLEGTFPAEAPTYPVLWVVYGESDIVPPFGEVVRIR